MMSRSVKKGTNPPKLSKYTAKDLKADFETLKTLAEKDRLVNNRSNLGQKLLPVAQNEAEWRLEEINFIQYSDEKIEISGREAALSPATATNAKEGPERTLPVMPNSLPESASQEKSTYSQRTPKYICNSDKCMLIRPPARTTTTRKSETKSKFHQSVPIVSNSNSQGHDPVNLLSQLQSPISSTSSINTDDSYAGSSCSSIYSVPITSKCGATSLGTPSSKDDDWENNCAEAAGHKWILELVMKPSKREMLIKEQQRMAELKSSRLLAMSNEMRLKVLRFIPPGRRLFLQQTCRRLKFEIRSRIGVIVPIDENTNKGLCFMRDVIIESIIIGIFFRPIIPPHKLLYRPELVSQLKITAPISIQALDGFLVHCNKLKYLNICGPVYEYLGLPHELSPQLVKWRSIDKIHQSPPKLEDLYHLSVTVPDVSCSEYLRQTFSVVHPPNLLRLDVEVLHEIEPSKTDYVHRKVLDFMKRFSSIEVLRIKTQPRIELDPARRYWDRFSRSRPTKFIQPIRMIRDPRTCAEFDKLYPKRQEKIDRQRELSLLSRYDQPALPAIRPKSPLADGSRGGVEFLVEWIHLKEIILLEVMVYFDTWMTILSQLKRLEVYQVLHFSVWSFQRKIITNNAWTLRKVALHSTLMEGRFRRTPLDLSVFGECQQLVELYICIGDTSNPNFINFHKLPSQLEILALRNVVIKTSELAKIPSRLLNLKSLGLMDLLNVPDFGLTVELLAKFLWLRQLDELAICDATPIQLMTEEYPNPLIELLPVIEVLEARVKVRGFETSALHLVKDQKSCVWVMDDWTHDFKYCPTNC